jgi:hypothetical protein
METQTGVTAMPSFVEKLIAEIVVNLCVGAIISLMSGASWTPDDAIRRNRRAGYRPGESNDVSEGEPDRARTCGEHQ